MEAPYNKPDLEKGPEMIIISNEGNEFNTCFEKLIKVEGTEYDRMPFLRAIQVQ